MVKRATPAAAISAAGTWIWSRRGCVVQVLTRESPKARLSAVQRSCAARASGVSPPHWRWASARDVSGAVAASGLAIKPCTYRTMSLGSTRTARLACELFITSSMGRPAGNSRVSFPPMNEDFVLLVLTAGFLAGGYRVWQSSLDAREAANRIAKDTCSRAVVQFLDGTVAFAGFRWTRNTRGQRRLLRTYTFDYTSDGFERAQGFIVLQGLRLEAVGLAGSPS